MSRRSSQSNLSQVGAPDVDASQPATPDRVSVHSGGDATTPVLDVAVPTPYGFSGLSGRIHIEIEQMRVELETKRQALVSVTAALRAAETELVMKQQREAEAKTALDEATSNEGLLSLSSSLKAELLSELTAYEADRKARNKGQLNENSQRHSDEYREALLNGNFTELSPLDFYDQVVQFSKKTHNSRSDDNTVARATKCLYKKPGRSDLTYQEAFGALGTVRDEKQQQYDDAILQRVTVLQSVAQKEGAVHAAKNDLVDFENMCQNRLAALKAQVGLAGKMRNIERQNRGFFAKWSYSGSVTKAEEGLLASISAASDSMDGYFNALELLKAHFAKYDNCMHASLSTTLLQVLMNKQYGFFGSDDPLAQTVDTVSHQTDESAASRESDASVVSMASEEAKTLRARTDRALEPAKESEDVNATERNKHDLDIGFVAAQRIGFGNDSNVSVLMQNETGGLFGLFHRSTKAREAGCREAVSALDEQLALRPPRVVA